MNLENRRIILTGAASGIGRAVLRELAAYPVRIVAVDRDQEKLAASCEEERGETAVITPYICDLSKETAMDGLFDYAVTEMGGVDLFIANAGFAYYEKLTSADWTHMEQIYQVNVFSPIYAAVKMQELNGKRPYKVVVTASGMGLVALPGYALYSSTKAALDRFAEGYRLELEDPSTLTLVYPIGTKTNFFDAANAAPTPWPTQTAVTVARAIIKGIKQDTPAIYPSHTFRAFLSLDRYLPFMHRIEQRLEKRRFDTWLAKQHGD